MCPEGGFRITALHAFLAHDGDDDEGVIAAPAEGGVMMPLVAADEDRLRSMRPVAERIARAMGQQVRLVRFTQREDLETIDPGAAKRN